MFLELSLKECILRKDRPPAISQPMLERSNKQVVAEKSQSLSFHRNDAHPSDGHHVQEELISQNPANEHQDWNLMAMGKAYPSSFMALKKADKKDIELFQQLPLQQPNVLTVP